MDIAVKNQIVEKILESNNETLLNEIKFLVGLSETDFWDELPEEIKQDIKEAEDQFSAGEGIPHKEVMAVARQRFLK